MPVSLDANAIRRWSVAGLDALRRHRGEIDKLNVFPVPDGDTGTNLVLTMTAAVEALDRPGPGGGVGSTLIDLARGALTGARGNSGVILAQFLRGFADALDGAHVADGHAVARALDRASTAAYQAVAAPVEGTILTVARAAARAAASEVRADAAAVAAAASAGARGALARTREQLATLARAGVPDAGGMGLTVLLDALAAALAGDQAAPAQSTATSPQPAATPVEPAVAAQRYPVGRPVGGAARGGGPGWYAYEVQYLLEAEPAAVDLLRATLAAIGDSVAIIGGEDRAGGPPVWNVHAHVDDVGAAIEAGVEAGRPYRISVTRFADQVAGRAVVVTCSGAGQCELFAAEGARVVPVGGGPPSAGEIAATVLDAGAGQVVVLADTAHAAVADAAAGRARSAGLHTAVVPTRSPVQALAAIAVRDPARRFEDDVIAMAEAAAACRSAELIRADADALTVVGPCRRGELFALVDGEVVLVGAEVAETARLLLDRLLSVGGELVTLVLGAGAPAGLVDELGAHLRERWPFVELRDYPGGQDGALLLVGVE